MKKIDKKTIFEIMAIILIAIFCISLTPKTLQNDTFYTIKIGEHIIHNGGVDMHDPFSWHELEYTYPHWLYDVMIYLIYMAGGMLGIYISTCIFATLLGIAIYKINTKLAKNQIISFIITFGAMYMLKDFIAARAQLVTFILFALQIFCIERLVDTSQKRYSVFLILISIIIANMHVAVWPFTFVLYLPYLAEYLIAVIEESIAKKYGKEVKKGERIIIEKRNGVKILIFTIVICILSGFLTPLGTTPYTYLPKTMIGNTTENINEHQPLVLINDEKMLSLIIILLALLIFTKAKMKLSDFLMLSGLLLLAFYSKRQVTMLVIICSPILNKLIYGWMEQSKKNADEFIINKVTDKFGITVISLLTLTLSVWLIKPQLRSPYVNKNDYPVEMSDYIVEYFNNDFTGVRLYNEYNYGSYLLFKGIPVFIDSRADLYAPEFNHGEDIFMDFMESSNLDKYFEDIFEKYDITHVILYKESKMNMVIEDAKLPKYKLIHSDDKFVFYEIDKSN